MSKTKQTDAEGLQLYIEQDGIPDTYPRRLRKACEQRRWHLAVRLEHDHMVRMVAWAKRGFPRSGGRRLSLAELRARGVR
jgi:hypothetical protein